MPSGEARLRQSIGHLEHRATLQPRLAVVVDAGGGDARVPEPLLHLGVLQLLSLPKKYG